MKFLNFFYFWVSFGLPGSGIRNPATNQESYIWLPVRTYVTVVGTAFIKGLEGGVSSILLINSLVSTAFCLLYRTRMRKSGKTRNPYRVHLYCASYADTVPVPVKCMKIKCSVHRRIWSLPYPKNKDFSREKTSVTWSCVTMAVPAEPVKLETYCRLMSTAKHRALAGIN